MLWRFLFQIHPGSIKGPQVVGFLQALLRHVPGKMLVIWDGAAIHRCKLVQEFARGTKDRLVLARLPAYAPELNPAEYLWAHLKEHEIANLCVREAGGTEPARPAALRRMRRRPRRIRACFAQPELWP